MHKLLYAVEMLADIIVEKEGAFGMIFGELEFEARWKVNNAKAYCRNRAIDNTHPRGLPNVTVDEVAEALLVMREYFKDELNVKDEADD
jgi:hypothetical protein